MTKSPLIMAALMTAASFAATATALAAPNPSGTGRPNQDCQSIELLGGSAPGRASSSPGSVFNEPGLDSANGGTANQAYERAGAPSQYDVACFQVSHSH
ncbi:MAG TPA: hypothetical protein VLF67_00255 [Candidatus Saccharimonas sp.]|nr:hypothetical protein [Candidatus Saccharimonas sp.]